jgi:hypothetical protein
MHDRWFDRDLPRVTDWPVVLGFAALRKRLAMTTRCRNA